jgi:hypothetical protein
MEALELLGFSIIVLVPAVLASFGGPSSPEVEHQALYSHIGFLKELLSSMQFGLVAVFFLSRHGCRSWADVASNKIPWPKQVLVGVGLWFAYYLFFDFWSCLPGLFSIRTPSIAWLHPTTGEETGLNAVFSGVNGLSEELMRVYLLVQLQRVGLRQTGAAIAAALAMTSYHFYQGAFTLIAFFIVHVFFNRLYLSRRPLLALIVWHILSDFMHSTDLVGWGFVSSMVNGSILIAVGGLARLFGYPL